MTTHDFTPALTTDPEAEPDLFRYFGEVFEIPAKIGAGAVLEFTATIKDAEDLAQRAASAHRRALTVEKRIEAGRMDTRAEVMAQAAIYRLLTAALGEHQIRRFLDEADRNGVEAAGLMEVCSQIQGVIADRPTKPSAVSSGTPSTNGGRSPEGGSSEVIPAYGTPPKRPQKPTAPTATTDGETPLVMTPRDRQAAMFEANSTPVGLLV